MRITHRAFLTLLIGVGAVPAAQAQLNFKAELINIGGGRPVTVTSPPGESARHFIVDKIGRIRILKNGNLLGTPFLDWQSNLDGTGEGGLLGMAFHPDYGNNGQFYISYTNTSAGGWSVISQFTVNPGNPDLADPTSEQIIWGPYPQQIQSHKAGDLHFGPDGLLYFSIGDGSDGGTLVGTAQDLMDPRGKILRFDVDLPFPHIPPSNPFVGTANALDEIYTYGLRNAFRFGIDPLTGDIWMADVGATSWEEINVLPAGTAPMNFGWPCNEGPNQTAFSACNPNPVAPLHAYDHSGGCAVISGAVYRGTQIPQLVGKYVFADYCSSRFWFMNLDGTGLTEISTEFEGAWVGGQNSSPTAIRADGVGDLWIVNHFSSRVWHVVPDVNINPPTTTCQGTPNSTGSGANLGYVGSQSVSANDSVLTITNAPTFVNGLFFYGQGQASISLGDGTLCVQPPLKRIFPIAQTNSQGAEMYPLDLLAPTPVPILAGSTWDFQFWYRDSSGGPMGFNFSGALEIDFGI